MDAVLRASAIYLVLLLISRITGKRSLAQITTFDFVLLLVIGEATQQALLGNDFSIINAAIVIVTLLTIDVGLSLTQARFPRLGPWLDDVPLVLVEDGQMLQRRMDKSRISEADILQAARATQGTRADGPDQVRGAGAHRGGLDHPEAGVVALRRREGSTTLARRAQRTGSSVRPKASPHSQ